ncbi:hypothetical protein TNCV_1050351 [Trichonephila clavipes]|nr:hypothetical protein TNCV_1050351 [Trichonephila clavipes]
MPSLRDGNAIKTVLMPAKVHMNFVNHPVPLTTEHSTALVCVGTDAEIPAHLSTLDLVSERLISPRIPFMIIRRLRRVHGGQFGILGSTRQQVIKRHLDRNRNSKTMKAPSSGREDWMCPKERRSTHVVLIVKIEGTDSGFGLETRYSAVASPIRSAQTLRLPATTANATGLPAQPTPCTHTKRASDFCSPFQGYLV